MSMKYIPFLLLIVVLVGSTTVFAQSTKAPNFRLPEADGKIIELSKYQGKIVLVNFWATWCPPCRAEIPDFIKVYNQYKSKGFEIIGIALDEKGWSVVKPFMVKMGINYPVVLGTGEVVRAYGGIQSIPTSFLLDKQGNIAGYKVGIIEKAELEGAIEKLLRENR